MEFQVVTRQVGTSTVVAVGGEIDNATAPQLNAELVSALEAGTPRVAVDLTDTDFLDSSGLGALVGATKRAQRSDATVVIVCPKQHLQRLFRMSRLDQLFPLYDTLEAATADA